MLKPNILILLVFLFCFFSACDDRTSANKSSIPKIVSGKISAPDPQNQTANADKKTEIPERDIKNAEAKNDLSAQQETVMGDENKVDEKIEYYDSQGKTDPFLSLIQEKPEEPNLVDDDQPQRILTPLEKIELSQIRLVAVVIAKNMRLAMVEESTGKGYEVTVGTFIGKNQGKVTEINDSSIMVTELVKDFKGKLKEQTQEIKLHKNDDEE